MTVFAFDHIRFTAMLGGLFFSLSFLIPTDALSSVSQDDDDKEKAKKVIIRAINSMGGDANLRKLEKTYVKAEGILFVDPKHTVKFKFEQWSHLPSSKKRIWSAIGDGFTKTFAEVMDATAAIRVADGVTTRYDPNQSPEVVSVRAYGEAMLYYPLLDMKKFQVAYSRLDKNGDDSFHVIRVATAKAPEMSFYFNSRTHLLAKTKSIGYLSETVTAETIEHYSDYKQVDGVFYPMKRSMNIDGKKVSESSVTEFKLIDSFPRDFFKNLPR